MSIFKSTFKPFVVRQVLTRQNLLQETNRPIEFSHYVSSKAPWARMTSLVDYNGSDALSKKYILMGGTLYPTSGSGIPAQRSGIGGKGAAYGGDLSTTQYGITPMPGILGVTTRSLGAYGSLTEATIKFQAWDVKQLEELSLLFMRPGYKVLLEWGWSMYLDTFKNGESYKSKTTPSALKEVYDKYNIQTTKYNTIDVFSPNVTQDFIYEKLEELRHRYSGNYDGVLGSIKNFEYVLQPNGSYECTTVLISIGDVIDSIRLNDTLGISIGQTSPTTNVNANTDTESLDNVDYSEIKSQFELLMDDYCKVSDANPRSNYPVITAIDNSIKEKDKDYIDKYIYKYSSRMLQDSDTPRFTSISGLIEGRVIEGELDRDQAYPISTDNPGDKRSYHYIQLSYLLHILNVFKNVFAAKEQTLIDIEIPSSPVKTDAISNGLCQASYNSISIDPNVAIIRNSQARLFKDSNGNPGFLPEVYKTETRSYAGSLAVIDSNMREYLYSNTNLGQIGNIYVNIKEIVSLYKQQCVSNKGYVYLGRLISELMDKVAFSLGSINDFDKFVSNDKIVIIDKHYTEVDADSNYASKFKINVSGNNTIVRKHKIESKIFPSQATMIAIAAQDRENIAAIQTATYVYLNGGLSDRLLKNTDTTRAAVNTTTEGAKRAKLQPILNLIEYVNNYVVLNKGMSAYYTSNITAMNGYLNTLLVELEGGTDYKAVVPISIDLTMDGLSGLTIGEIFTVDKKVLPKDYIDKRIGFIVTGISNEINTSSWLTNIKTQMCLLDQANLQILSKEKADKLLKDLQNAANSNIAENSASVRYYNILAALTMDVLMGRLVVKTLEGKLEVVDAYKDTLYTKAAVAEFANGYFDLNYVLREFENTYNRLYPKTTATSFYQAPRVNITEEIVKYGEYIVKETRIKELNNPTVKLITESKFVNIKDGEALKNIISAMSLYNALVPDVRNAFDTNQTAVISLVKSGPVRTGVQTTQAIGGVGGTVTPGLVTGAPIIFDKIDVTKAVNQTTGNLTRPIPFISGYRYF